MRHHPWSPIQTFRMLDLLIFSLSSIYSSSKWTSLGSSEWEAVGGRGFKWFTTRMDFINSPQPLAPRCPKYLFPLDFHRISRRYFGISPDFRSIFTGDPTNRDILKGCRRLPQSGDLLRRVDNSWEENRNPRPSERTNLYSSLSSSRSIYNLSKF